jgi:hypothetical protein
MLQMMLQTKNEWNLVGIDLLRVADGKVVLLVILTTDEKETKIIKREEFCNYDVALDFYMSEKHTKWDNGYLVVQKSDVDYR